MFGRKQRVADATIRPSFEVVTQQISASASIAPVARETATSSYAVDIEGTPGAGLGYSPWPA